ncbi:MAG TPA: metalloregulator ArsR/SmtB family transcription factor [Gammaproteobacteria bacterium]|nr:metalloregulator ArsR/SmtB family transcription factor [Gammaproteobacteria bacterium]
MKKQHRDLHWRRYELQAEVVHGVAHPIRLAIVDLLRDGDVCVCDIATAVGAGRSNVSRHLAVMARSGIVSTRKDGLKVFYRLRTPCITDFMACATRTLEHDLEERARVLADA